MSDSFELTLHSPLTKEDWNKISDVEHEHTNFVTFQTPQGRQVRYIKCDVFDKIREEIEEEKECAYADFERYKVEYLGQDWEDVCDSLPQDDFRYGMERCIEIINKYRTESEAQESKPQESEV